jgi:hypothetical protein
MAQKPQEEVPPFQSKDSFDSQLIDWQNIRDVQYFFNRSWQLDNDFYLTLNMKAPNGMVFVQGLLWKPKEKLTVDQFGIYRKQDTAQKFEFKALKDKFTLKLDGGFRRSFNYNFNPYYELAVTREKPSFQHMLFGFNYHDGETHTHHELSLSKSSGEYLINISNSFMMNWKLFSYFASYKTSYGGQTASESTQIVSANFKEKLKLYLMKYEKNEGQETKDPDIHFGARIMPSEKSQIILEIASKDMQNFQRRLGAQVMYGEHLFGKFYLTDFSSLRFLVRYTLPQQLRLTGSANLSLSRSGFIERKTPKFDWGLRLDWQF